MRMEMERMTMAGRHVGANQQELLGIDDIGPANPFIVRPRIRLAQRIRDFDKAAIRAHGLSVFPC
jgi:hypothetical protein